MRPLNRPEAHFEAPRFALSYDAFPRTVNVMFFSAAPPVPRGTCVSVLQHLAGEASQEKTPGPSCGLGVRECDHDMSASFERQKLAPS